MHKQFNNTAENTTMCWKQLSHIL